MNLKPSRSFVVPFLALALLALFWGLWAGLLRLGWNIPGLLAALPPNHGAMMVSGFLGTLVTLERVAALKRRWMMLAPALTGLGGLATLVPGAGLAGPLMICLGSLGAVLILGVIIRREPRLFTVTMGLGTVTWLVGNLLWLAGWPIFRLVFWWAAYLILTVGGERLELSRVLRLNRAQNLLFGLSLGIFLAGVIYGSIRRDIGIPIMGAGLVALSLWFLRYDIARRNWKHPNSLTRFIARCLASGFVWLGVAGLLSLYFGDRVAGTAYDATLHAIFLGFVMSMIFGHAPIIFPSLLDTPITFSPAYYLHLGLLHLSLLLRVSSDLAGWWTGVQWGGLLNEAAVLLFLGITFLTVRKSLKAG